ncbi:MAG: molybdenum cofactor guanylyltransferase [Terriglobales bacterium]
MITGVNRLHAFILAGGKSSRMGQDKAFLSWGEETLLSNALKLAGDVAASVYIVGDTEKFAEWGSVVEDVYRDRGPLGGIHAALAGSTAELNLMLAVDLPLIKPEFLHYLVSQANESDVAVTLPRAGNHLQPLCAVYRREFAAIAEQSLLDGKNKIDPLFPKVKTRVLLEQELAQRGLSSEMFRNLNTPEELEEARRGLM